MKNSTITVLILIISNPFFALANESSTSQAQETTVLSAPTSVSQGGHVIGPLINYGENNGGNTNVGSIGNNVGGSFTSSPTIPLPYRNIQLESPNNTSAKTIFAIFSEIVTRKKIQNYKDGMIEADKRKSFWDDDFDDILNDISIRPTVENKAKKINKLWIVPGIWRGLQEDVDYVKIATVTAFAKSKLPFKQDLVKALEEWGLDNGGNILVPVFSIDGGEVIFNNQASALSGFSSMAQVTVSSMFGWAFNPSAGVSNGSNSAEVRPFIGVQFIRVKNPKEFFAKSKQVFSRKKKESKTVVKCKKLISQINNDLFTLTDNKEIGKKRFLRGVNFLSFYKEVGLQSMLIAARDDFEKVIERASNNELESECNFYLAAIWNEIGTLQKPGTDRNIFWARSGVHAARSGMPDNSTPPVLSRLVLN